MFFKNSKNLFATISGFEREEQGEKSVKKSNNIAQNLRKRVSTMLAMSVIKTMNLTIGNTSVGVDLCQSRVQRLYQRVRFKMKPSETK